MGAGSDAVAAANRDFYAAHESRNLEAMSAVWDHSERAVCTHPGWPILRGWSAIESSWRSIFSGPGRNQFITTNESITMIGDTAVVTLDENLVDGARTATIAATNVFVSGDGRWRLLVHHGSPVVTPGPG